MDTLARVVILALLASATSALNDPARVVPRPRRRLRTSALRMAHTNICKLGRPYTSETATSKVRVVSVAVSDEPPTLRSPHSDPYFTINDLEKAKPHLDQMVEATKSEEGCIYYGESS